MKSLLASTREDDMLTSYTEEFSDVIVLHMTGIMTLNFLKDIEERWDEQLRKRPGVLALNLKGVVTIDSITINHLFNLNKRASAMNVKLIICDTSEELKRIFELIKMERVVTMMDYNKFHQEYIATDLSLQNEN